MNIENALRRFEDFAWRRFIRTSDDFRVVRHSAHLCSVDLTPWVRDEQDIDQPIELDLAICWRDNCGHPVARDDEVGLCRRCVAELRAL